MTLHIENLLTKARWRQDLNRRGYEGKLPMASERLAETLRAELRAILDNGGKPFDLQVARHVYDFAMAAKDLLTVSATTVEDVTRVIADNNGAMESLTGPNDPPPPEVASETFGARIMRELFAALPMLRSKSAEDPVALVTAIADARERGMLDLAGKLEQRLLGTPLEVPPAKITHAAVVHGSYEHGFIDGSMKDNFDRGTVDGCASVALSDQTPAYKAGFEAGRTRRLNAQSTSNHVEDSPTEALSLAADLQIGDGGIVEPGQRHAMLKSIAGALRFRGAGEQEILVALRNANQTRCKPPKSEEELARLAAWAVQQPEQSARELAIDFEDDCMPGGTMGTGHGSVVVPVSTPAVPESTEPRP